MTDAENSPTGLPRDASARCREPFQSAIDTATRRWIEGTLSHPELALELWQLHDQLQFTELPSRSYAAVLQPEVRHELGILVQAMLAATLYPTTTPEFRRALLDQARSDRGDRSGASR